MERAYKECKIIEQTNVLIKETAEKHGAIYVDLYSLYFDGRQLEPSLSKDGVHLYPEAYERWADAIRKYVYN